MNLAFQQRTRPQNPPDELFVAIDAFNRHDYLSCCRTLEFLSLHEPRLERNLYQGIIQIATALMHWQEGDYRRTIRQLKLGLRLLQRISPACLGVDAAGLIFQTEQTLEILQKLGMEKMGELDVSLVPTIRRIQR